MCVLPPTHATPLRWVLPPKRDSHEHSVDKPQDASWTTRSQWCPCNETENSLSHLERTSSNSYIPDTALLLKKGQHHLPPHRYSAWATEEALPRLGLAVARQPVDVSYTITSTKLWRLPQQCYQALGVVSSGGNVSFSNKHQDFSFAAQKADEVSKTAPRTSLRMQFRQLPHVPFPI